MSRLTHTLVNATPVQTTTSATVNVLTWTPASHSPVVNNCVVRAIGVVLGKTSTNTVRAIEIGAVFKVISGTVSLIGAATAYLADGDMTPTTFAGLDTTSNVINLSVSGLSGQTINWTGWLTLITSEL